MKHLTRGLETSFAVRRLLEGYSELPGQDVITYVLLYTFAFHVFGCVQYMQNILKYIELHPPTFV